MKKKILLVFPLLIAIFISLYFFLNLINNSNKNSLKYYTKKIDEINDSTISLMKNENININKSKDRLPEIISDLLELKNNLNSLTLSNNKIELKNNMLKGINNNIHIYEQILSILNNPKGKDIDKSCESLKKYKEECLKYYALTPKSVKYIGNSIYFIEGLIRENKDREIHESQYKDFVDSLDSILSTFIEIKVDFLSYREDINSQKISYSEMTTTLEYIENELSEINNEFSKLAVPNEGIESYKLFSKTLDHYNTYLKSFTYALNKEIQNNKEKTSAAALKSLNYLYTEPELNYKLMNNNYNEFVKIYLEFKKENNIQ